MKSDPSGQFLFGRNHLIFRVCLKNKHRRDGTRGRSNPSTPCCREHNCPMQVLFSRRRSYGETRGNQFRQFLGDQNPTLNKHIVIHQVQTCPKIIKCHANGGKLLHFIHLLQWIRISLACMLIDWNFVHPFAISALCMFSLSLSLSLSLEFFFFQPWARHGKAWVQNGRKQ